MNKIISGALFSARDAREQRLRAKRRREKVGGEPDDVRDFDKAWDRAAEGFRRNDPGGTKLAELFQAAKE